MASFTDTPLRFNQFINTIPVDTYAAVGLQKQLEYRQGADKVQSYLDSISGLNVIRPQDKDYINKKLEQLTTQVNNVASSDWSNQAIVKQVGSMAGAVYNDGIVQSAIAGTKKYLKDEQDIEQAKKDGKWAPENEWILRRQMKSWLENPSAGATYQTGGYKAYQNVNADIMKMWSDSKPNSRLVQKPNGDFYAYELVNNQRVGKDGRTLVETQVKELRPDEIAEQINALITPAQREQLAMTGAYNYRGIATPEDFNKFVDKHFKGSEDYYDALVAQANQQKALMAGNQDAMNQLNESIAQIGKKKTELTNSKNEYKSQGLQNPDAVKSAMYYENWLQGISKQLGYSDVSTKIVDNPAYKAQLDEAKMWLDFEKAKMADDRARDLATLRASLVSGKGKKTLNADGSITWEPETAEVLPLQEEERVGVDLANFKDKMGALNDQSQQRTNELLYRFFGNRYVNRSTTDLNKDGIIEYNYALKPEMRDEANGVISEWWDKYRRGDANIDPKLKIALAQQDEAKLVSRKLGEAVQTVEKDADNFVRGNPRFEEYRRLKSQFDKTAPVLVNGQSVTPADVQKYRELDIAMNRLQQQVGGQFGSTVRQTPGPADFTRYNLSPQKYEAIRQSMNQQGSPTSNQVVNMYNLSGAVAERVGDVDKQRTEYVNTQLRRFQGVFNQVAINVPSAKTEDVGRIANFVQNLAATAKETGLSGATNWGNVRQMIGEKHRRETSYNYVQDRDGNVRIRISNPDVDKGTPQEITVEPETARINNFYTPDYLGTARSLLDLGEGMKTGTTLEESIPVNNGRTGRYKVRYEVENYNGQYQLNLYVSDTQDKSVDGKFVPIPRGLFPDWNSLSGFLSTDLNETFVRGLLGGNANPASTQGSTFGGSIFQNNPFIQQMQQNNNQQ